MADKSNAQSDAERKLAEIEREQQERAEKLSNAAKKAWETRRARNEQLAREKAELEAQVEREQNSRSNAAKKAAGQRKKNNAGKKAAQTKAGQQA